MLHVEEKNADRRGDQNNGQVNDKDGHWSKSSDETSYYQQYARVGSHSTDPSRLASEFGRGRPAMLDDEEKNGAEPQHDEWVAIESILDSTPSLQT
jgi:hypothetical protein